MNQLTPDTFQSFVTSAPTTVVDFYATNCGPCRIMEVTLRKLQEELPNVPFAKVNVDDYSELAAQYGIRGTPTVLIFRGSTEPAEVLVGARHRIDAIRKAVLDKKDA